MAVQNKRKHKTLTLMEKNEIIKKLENGGRLIDLANEYGVGRATVHDIKKKGDRIKNFIAHREDNVKSVRKTLKSGKFPQVEDSLYAWFVQEREKHATISGEILKDKAKFFYKKIMKKDDFQASDGWLDKFKRRFGIRLSTFTGEKYSCDVAAVEHSDFHKTIAEMELNPDQVYSAGECGLFWRLSSSQHIFDSDNRDVPDEKLAKEKITFMPCSNASGTHKLDLLVIGKIMDPIEFEDVTLPFVYKYERRGSMTKSVLTEWFHETFVPSVKTFLEIYRLPRKALLLLNTFPEYPDHDLKSEDSSIRVMFWSSDVIRHSQPINQDVFSTIKMHYKKELLHEVLTRDQNIIQALQEINLKDVCFNFANAWENIPRNSLVCSWQTSCPHFPLLEMYNNSNEDIAPMQEEFHNYSNSDLMDFRNTIIDKFVDESDDLTLDDYENLLVKVKEEKPRFIIHQDINPDIQIKEEVGVDDWNEVQNNEAAVRTINHSDAVEAFNDAIKWAEEYGVSTSDILTLKKLQARALTMSLLDFNKE